MGSSNVVVTQAHHIRVLHKRNDYYEHEEVGLMRLEASLFAYVQLKLGLTLMT